MDLSFIIPCYNEEGNIKAFFEETEKVFNNTNITYEYVFINDGSTDSTYNQLVELYNKEILKNITIINFSRNFGKESAIFAGLNNCSGTSTCLIDADLQQSPSTALEMYNLLINSPSCDCVCAYQGTRKEGKLISFLKNTFYKIMNDITETEIKNGASDFRVFNNNVKQAILSLGEYHRFSKGIFSWIGFNIEYIEYSANDRNDGKTKWNIYKLFKYAFSGIISFSTAPLKLSIILGFIATIFSFIYSIVTIIRKLTSNISVDGFTQLVILITLFGGLILLCSGITGEYIAKIYQQSKNRPIYIAKEILKREKK